MLGWGCFDTWAGISLLGLGCFEPWADYCTGLWLLIHGLSSHWVGAVDSWTD